MLKNYLMNLQSQRGAMFGLDARVVMVIFGALALIVGTTIFMTVPQIQAQSLVRDIASYQSAVEGMQYDVSAPIGEIITTGGLADIKRFQALNDRTVVQAADQPRWMGPYLQSRTSDSTVHENYGQMYLIEAARDDYTSLTCGSCFYWLRIDEVPENAFTIVNDKFDGSGEASPATNGKVRWLADDGTNPDRLFVRLARAL